MKVSLNWVKQFIDTDMSVEDIVAKIGAQLGAVESVTDLGQQYKGIIIAKVMTCSDHPNADRLHVVTIDDGGVAADVSRNEDGYVQVVCGAPNVREGLLVAWLPPGSTVPSSYSKDPFVLDTRELRGVLSNGMLASPKELAIGDDHAGILEVDLDVAPGTYFAEAYELNDYIIDIENKMFTHRPDCFGILGVAREIAGIQGKQFTSPEWYQMGLGRIRSANNSLPVVVENAIPQQVPRFVAVALSGITIQPSPVIMRTYLSRVGIRPISNVVDVTNYIMYMTGQPLHAYDYDKLVGLQSGSKKPDQPVRLGARFARREEQLHLLSGKTLSLTTQDVIITVDDKPIGLGGVMGGAETEVDETTKRIVLEVANFEMYTVRRTSMRHGLFTDAVTRFNKGQSPLQNLIVAEEAVAMLESLSGAHVASAVQDEFAGAAQPAVVVSTQFINERLGLQLSAEDMVRILRLVECDVQHDDQTITIQPPFWRTDIVIPEDVVEEVGRLHGYDNLPLDLPKRSIAPAWKNPTLALKQQLREALASCGANELLTYSFVHGNIMQRAGQDPEIAYQLANALSPELQYYRLSVIPSLLDKVHANIKAGYDECALFEIGKAHAKSLVIRDQEAQDEGLPAEMDHVALVYAANDKLAEHRPGTAYYRSRYVLEQTLQEVGLLTYTFTQAGELNSVQPELLAWLAPFDPDRSAFVFVDLQDHPQTLLGIVGEFKSSVQKQFKLPRHSSGFEIDTLVLQSTIESQLKKHAYVPLPRFPKIEQDICLQVAADMAYGQVYACVQQAIVDADLGQVLPKLSPVDIYQKGKHATHKNITLRLSIASYERTLTAGEVNALLDIVAATAEAQLGAVRQ